MPTQRRPRPATMADIEALPEGVKGEIIDGELYTSPRPRFRHARAEAGIVLDIAGPFDRGVGGPGGWWILAEPGIELPRAPEVSPDLAGWRRENMPDPPDPADPIRVVPDWVCEILSPSTRSFDLLVKRRFYAEIGVPSAWYVDVEAKAVTVSRLDGGSWREVGVYGGDATARLAPFDAVEIDMSRWWTA